MRIVAPLAFPGDELPETEWNAGTFFTRLHGEPIFMGESRRLQNEKSPVREEVHRALIMTSRLG
jgi:hypothetical protein